jgi:cell surface protein SprA
MNTINAYYEYSVDVKPNMSVGQNYITDIRNTQVTMDNGQVTEARWLQFKIPVAQPENTVGNISDFRSIRFMRMFMTGFSNEVTVRFGSLDLVRGDWRRYTNTLDPTDTNPADDKTNLDVLAVNVQENNDRCPINYIIPPGVEREQLYSANSVINQNEQSLSLKVSGDGLEPQDSRAVFKNVSVDMRQFKKLKMFLHAESLSGEIALRDDQMTGFIRFGNDFTQNFYQIEIPLKVTLPSGSVGANCGALSADVVWPAENEIDLSLALLTNMKINKPKDALDIYYPDDDTSIEGDPDMRDGNAKLRLGIRGNPNFGMVRNLMLGVKNNETHQDIKGEVWFEEWLRY